MSVLTADTMRTRDGSYGSKTHAPDRQTAAGARAFVLNYRRKSDGRERRWTIGSFPNWTTGAARDEAKRLKRLIDGGADPVGEHQGERSAPTVADLCERFEKEY